MCLCMCGVCVGEVYMCVVEDVMLVGVSVVGCVVCGVCRYVLQCLCVCGVFVGVDVVVCLCVWCVCGCGCVWYVWGVPPRVGWNCRRNVGGGSELFSLPEVSICEAW